MVIACPNCARKYQIDTSRIPSGGTSFTCWSCRATVSVDTGGGTTATTEPGPGTSAPASPASVQQPPRTAESSIPLSAMRFFESLAAEASMNKQMAGQAPKPAEPPATTPEPARPARIEGAQPMASQPPLA